MKKLLWLVIFAATFFYGLGVIGGLRHGEEQKYFNLIRDVSSAQEAFAKADALLKVRKTPCLREEQAEKMTETYSTVISLYTPQKWSLLGHVKGSKFFDLSKKSNAAEEIVGAQKNIERIAKLVHDGQVRADVCTYISTEKTSKETIVDPVESVKE